MTPVPRKKRLIIEVSACFAIVVAIRDVRLTEGFRTTAGCRRAGLGAGPSCESLVRRKPRGGEGAVWSGAAYGDFGVADGALAALWERVGRVVRGWSEDDELV